MSQAHPNQHQRTATPNLGRIRNRLGILSEDLRKVRPQRFVEVTGLGSAEIARRLEKARPQVYREEISVDKNLMKRIVELVMATDLVFDLFKQSIAETRKWMMVPNTITFGDSPFEVCMRGDGKILIDWLRVRSGNKD